MTGRPRITVLNESEEFLELVEVLLEEEAPYQVTTLRLPNTSAEEVAATRPELIIIDLAAERRRGTELLRAMLSSRATRHVPIILTTPTAVMDASTAALARDHPNVTHLPKPFTADAVEQVVRRLLPARE